MHSKRQSRRSPHATILQYPTFALTLLVFVVFITALAPAAAAQSFQVLYSFTGGWDGQNPRALVTNRSGNLYGVSSKNVFELSDRQSQWRLSTLYNPTLQGGVLPTYGITLGPDENLYWADALGFGTGCSGPCGEVIQLKPPATPCKTALCFWMRNQIYEFQTDWWGFLPDSPVTFNQQGVLYGTTMFGGQYGQPGGFGVLYYVAPVDGGWQGGKAHDFGRDFPNGDGANPEGTLLIDHSGNVYGTLPFGAPLNGGGVYTLATQDGYSIIYPDSKSLALVDDVGNLYGQGSGGVFEMTRSNDGWTLTEIYPLPRGGGITAMDSAGNLYGATGCCVDPGTIFKLSRTGTTWSYTELYNFTGGSDGFGPSGLVLDSAGDLYGTAVYGGNPACSNGMWPLGCGVIFKITLN